MMKFPLHLLILSLSFSTWVACSPHGNDETQEEFSNDTFPQKWQLVEMSGQMANSTRTGKDIDWQEYYLLEKDGTFVKSRTRDGKTTTASGVYELNSNNPTEKQLILTFDEAGDLIGTCFSGDRKEILVFQDNKLSGTWQMCDGPGLIYEQTTLSQTP